MDNKLRFLKFLLVEFLAHWNSKDTDVRGEATARLDYAHRSFAEVLDADKHQDDKAQRILTAMAFVTTAGAFIFLRVRPSVPLAESQSTVFAPYFNTIPFVTAGFFVFIASIAIGTVFFLAALGPSLNLPTVWGQGNALRNGVPQSLLFFEKISRMKSDVWTNYWKSSSSPDIQRQLTDNYIYESHLIAGKVNRKIRWMQFGKPFFQLALATLVMLVIPLLTTVANLVYGLSLLVLGVLFVQSLIENWEYVIIRLLLLLLIPTTFIWASTLIW